MAPEKSKPKLRYDKWNPNASWVAAVVVAKDADPHYVWRCYSLDEIERGIHRKLSTGLEVLTVNAARERYDLV